MADKNTVYMSEKQKVKEITDNVEVISCLVKTQ